MMHSNFNKVMVSGRLTADPEMVSLPSGDACVNFSIALNSSWKTGEESKEEVSFIDCKAYRGTAEIINKNFYKGRPIFVEGRLKQDRWEKKDGSKGDRVRVIVKHFEYLDPPKKEDDNTIASEPVEVASVDNSGDELTF